MRKFLIMYALLLSGKSYAYEIGSSHVNDAIKRAANKVGIPERLLRAVCYAESGLKPWAFVHGDGGGNNHAFGLCQVLRETGANFIRRDPGCERDFNDRSIMRTYENCNLFGVYTNAYVAAKVLKYQLNRYGGSMTSAIAAYNSGTVKTCINGWVSARGKRLYRCIPGGLLNQKYVDRVMEAFTRNL